MAKKKTSKRGVPGAGAQARASNLAYPTPPAGQGGQGTAPGQGYGAPQTGGYTLGLNTTSHAGSNYPQPNSAGNPDPASTAPPAPVPGSGAYNPNIAGNAPPASMSNPGIQSGDEPPDYPS